jgi:Holliday junction DNA helicase RuvB
MDGRLSKPFRDRFKLRFVFTPYSEEESAAIAKVHAERLKINLTNEAAAEIAKRGRGVPRVVVSLLERCRDTAVAMGKKEVNDRTALITFVNMGVDDAGFTAMDIKVLKILYAMGAPVGAENLAIILNEDKKVLSETIEPFLIQRGLIARTGRGRTVTVLGERYLKAKGHIDRDSGGPRLISREMQSKRRM